MYKESFYSIDNIQRVTEQICRELPSYCLRKRFQFTIDNSALLVLDMQKYFLEASSHAYIPSACAILPGIQELIHTFHDADRPVIFTCHSNTERNAGMMKRWWHEIIHVESPLSKLTSELDCSKGIIIHKNQYDAFFKTSLKKLLYNSQSRQVVIGGVMTHLCCETTARAAFVHGFEVFFLIDGTATYNIEFQKATLQNLGHGFAELVTVNEIITGANGKK